MKSTDNHYGGEGNVKETSYDIQFGKPGNRTCPFDACQLHDRLLCMLIMLGTVGDQPQQKHVLYLLTRLPPQVQSISGKHECCRMNG